MNITKGGLYIGIYIILNVVIFWFTVSADIFEEVWFYLFEGSFLLSYLITHLIWKSWEASYAEEQRKRDAIEQRFDAKARKKEREERARKINEEEERNFKETGFKESDRQRGNREQQNAIDKRRQQTETLRQQTETLIKEVKAALKPLKKPEINLYSKVLREHSVVIDNEDPEILHKLIRLKNYIESETKEIVKLKGGWCVLTKLKTRKNSSAYDQLLEETKEQSNFIVERYQYINRLIVFGSMMVQALKDDDKFLFFDIYEKLDSFGILQNTWEKQVKDGLDNIGDKLDRTNTKLEQLMYVLKEVEGNITAELQTLETSLATEISRLDDSMSGISDGIEGIDSKLGYSNMLNTYNTYQLYRIRKG